MVTKLGTAGNDVLTGTDGDDTLQGLAGDDQLTGGKGADFLDGGTGIDTAHYDHASAGVGVNLVGEGFLGEADHDAFSGVENVTGSAFADSIRGVDSAVANILHGNGGNDIIRAGEGDDSVFGDAGNDLINGGRGADHLDDGAGIDTVDYQDSPAAVTVSLNAMVVAAGGDAEGDTITGFENIVGSNFGDFLTGSNG